MHSNRNTDDSDSERDLLTQACIINPSNDNQIKSVTGPQFAGAEKLCHFVSAVKTNNLELLDDCLQKADLNINTRFCHEEERTITEEVVRLYLERKGKALQPAYFEETALIMSIRLNRSFEFINRLINSNCDFKICNFKGQTALHLAIENLNSPIAYELVKKGADVNVRCNSNFTPLHYAVKNNNVESVCMLLAYGADVRVVSDSLKTPLELSFQDNNVEIIKILLPYYYEFSNVNLRNFILPDKSYDFDFEWEDILLIEFALQNGYIEPFKLIWSRMDIRLLSMLPPEEDVLTKFLDLSKFNSSQWLDCLYFILETPNFHFVFKENAFFVKEAFFIASGINFEPHHKMGVLFMSLSIGIDVYFYHIQRMFDIVGFGEVLDALIYAGNHDWSDPELHLYLLLHFILSFKVDCTPENVYEYLYKQLIETEDPDEIIRWFKYFSLTPKMKSNLENAIEWYSEEYNKKLSISLQTVPEFPSLFELSRLGVQRYVKLTNKITKPYQFHDAVKKLPLPAYLKEVVLFKRPIYK